MAFTPIGRLLIEALVVGITFLVLFAVVRSGTRLMFRDKGANSNFALALEVAFTAALFHIVCEYTGLNEWYCRNRP